jgi:hypothetical protein
MQPDYRDAAERHWEDADDLMSNNRIANADHLFGLSAECGTKAVMQGLGMALNPDGVPVDKQHRVHINVLWDEFVTFAQNRGGARYALHIAATPNPFDDWDVAQRYCHRSRITKAIATRHQRGARTAMQILSEAILDGVVS